MDDLLRRPDRRRLVRHSVGEETVTDSAIWDEARSLAGNVASLWNGGAAILDWIEQSAEGRSAGPWEAVRRLGPAGVEGLPAETREAIHDAFQQLTRYLTAETWFDRIVAQDARFVGLKERPIAYFCAEFGLAAWLPIYSGGLGVLAGDVMKEASDLGLPFVGVGLFYRHGFFRQQLDNYGYQTELYPELDPEALPLVAVRDSSGEELRVTVPLANRTVAVRVWRLQVGRTPLYLLDTDLPENEA
ncbi:MAG: DUF3417 domain-containing protein, partial [Chloroflexi bacterium]|nr:DUF3417 domain-containing protein [Chloroflexota bacterium]